MKKFFALLALLLSVCCVPKPPLARAPAPDVTTVTAWRDFELVLHVDEGFNEAGRALIEKAAGNIRRLTHDRARLKLEYDLDFDSVENLKAHHDARHSFVIGVTSDLDIVQAIDGAIAGPGTVLAATAPMRDGSTAVFLILDRIPSEKFEAVVTHEFGHVIGLPDLDAYGAIMSGHEVHGVPAPSDWTPADVELCRKFRYCD